MSNLGPVAGTSRSTTTYPIPSGENPVTALRLAAIGVVAFCGIVVLIALAGCGTIGVTRRGTLEQVEANPFQNVGGEWHGQFEQSDPTEFTFKLPKVTF